MGIFSLYRDFFKFLEKFSSRPGAPSKKWPDYRDCYYRPHKGGLDVFFSHFPFIDSSALRQRVETIKAADYSWLKSLCALNPPERIIAEAYEECLKVVPCPQEPEAYLFVGFFSPDGFVMDFRGKPVIGFGLERFQDFRLLKILFAHEYAHFLLKLINREVPRQKRIPWLLISEGLGTYFSSSVFPQQSLSDHFLFRKDRWNWCRENETNLREIYCSGRFSSDELMDFYLQGNPKMDLPPRAAKYLGFQAVNNYLTKNPEVNLGRLLLEKNVAFSIKI